MDKDIVVDSPTTRSNCFLVATPHSETDVALYLYYGIPLTEDDEEEREWDALFAQPHVQAGLEQLAEEAERQIAAGEREAGGFAIE